jgi:hypothetical protein
MIKASSTTVPFGRLALLLFFCRTSLVGTECRADPLRARWTCRDMGMQMIRERHDHANDRFWRCSGQNDGPLPGLLRIRGGGWQSRNHNNKKKPRMEGVQRRRKAGKDSDDDILNSDNDLDAFRPPPGTNIKGEILSDYDAGDVVLHEKPKVSSDDDAGNHDTVSDMQDIGEWWKDIGLGTDSAISGWGAMQNATFAQAREALGIAQKKREQPAWKIRKAEREQMRSMGKQKADGDSDGQKAGETSHEFGSEDADSSEQGSGAAESRFGKGVGMDTAERPRLRHGRRRMEGDEDQFDGEAEEHEDLLDQNFAASQRRHMTQRGKDRVQDTVSADEGVEDKEDLLARALASSDDAEREVGDNDMEEAFQEAEDMDEGSQDELVRAELARLQQLEPRDAQEGNASAPHDAEQKAGDDSEPSYIEGEYD